MKMRVQMIKMILGTGVAGWLFFDAAESVSRYGGRWWNFVFGAAVLFVTVGNVRFMRGAESVWGFLLSAAAFFVVNVRAAVVVVDVFLNGYLLVTKVLLGIVVWLSLLAAEEILLGVIARYIWPRQRDEFLDVVREKGEMD